MVPGSEILIKNVGINPTRDGILRVCQAMGADITLENCSSGNGEPTADLLVRYTPNLKATVIGGELIPTLIDELPMIAILACFADGTTIIKDAEELKVKESNRIDLVARNLSAMGAKVIATDDGLIIEGGHPLHGTVIETKYDHRIAMSFAVAALAADGLTQINHAECVNISYPAFYQHLASLTGSQNYLFSKECVSKKTERSLRYFQEDLSVFLLFIILFDVKATFSFLHPYRDNFF